MAAKNRRLVSERILAPSVMAVRPITAPSWGAL
jgi:hypothetical protein